MAAGIGSRYGGLKQIDPVGPNGEIILDYSLYDAARAGFDRVVFLIRRDIEKTFRETIGRRIEKRMDAEYAFQELGDLPAGFEAPGGRVKPWGTAHAVLSCRHLIRSPFAVINADDYYGSAAYQVLAGHLRGAGDTGGARDICMVGYRLANTLSEHGHVARGVCRVGTDGYLAGIDERTRIQRRGEKIRFTEDGSRWTVLPPDTTVSMNIWGFTPGVFEDLETGFAQFLHSRSGDLDKAEYYLPELVGSLVAERKARVKVLPTDARWFGVTYPEDRPIVQQAIRELLDLGIYPLHL